jgi:hypothetical protein
MSCRHDCPPPPAFPAPIFNRPALARIGYRIGDYARFRAHLLAQLDRAHELAAWTHRGADDPGIALLECTAVAGEIVAFYQQLYANEAFLRCAQWRESVARLVALTGYRLAPGLGGAATFALAVSGELAVSVPAGFGFKAQLEGADAPAIFESLAQATAYPWLSRFQLYRPRLGPASIAAGDGVLELAAVGAASSLSARQAVTLEPGDRLLLVPDTGTWDSGGGSFASPQARHEVLVVKAVDTVLDRIVIQLEGGPALARGTAVQAYKLGRSFRHFGHNAPARIGSLNPTTGIMTFTATPFMRYVNLDPSPTRYGDALDFSYLQREEMPLDAAVDDVAAGGVLIITGELLFDGVSSATPMTVVREIARLHQDTLTWGGLAGSATVVTLSERVITNDSIVNERFDLRRVQFHEAVSPPLTLRAASDWADGDFGLDTELEFFGTHAQALALAGRDLLLADDQGVLQQVRVDSAVEEFDPAGREALDPWLWRVRLDQPPAFPRERFDESDNRVTVYGNLVTCDQGETQAQAILGSGDARVAFQTFALSKAPLTYLLHSERTPPQVPELEVYVDGILWQRVETFFASGAQERVYVVREDDAGDSLVQFGDGKTGARLSSGRGNVVARWRVGAGAYGPLAAGQLPKASGRLQPLTEVWMPAPATGGAEPETEDTARAAAPARMQSLGRLVGLADYEAETLALPGVRKARAAWVAPQGSPRLQLVVLTDGGTATEAQAVAAAMAAANRCRGAARFPIETVQGIRQYLYLDLSVGYAADRLAEDIEPAVRAALGVEEGGSEPEDGVFGFEQRQFGEGAHVSQVIGEVQQVAGVVWVRVDAFQAIALGVPPPTDPAALVVPAVPVRHAAIGCPAHALLALHHAHLRLNLAQETAAEECE